MIAAARPELRAEAPALERWLRQQLQREDLALSAFESPSHGGFSNDTLLCQARWTGRGGAESRGLVVRSLPPGPGIFPSYDLERQWRVMQVLAERTAIPVPGVLCVEAEGSVLGRPFYVMERVRGRIPSDVPPYLGGGWLYDASPEQQALAQQGFVELVADIQRIDWQAVGLGFLDRPELGATGLDQEFAYWRRYLDWASQERALPVLEAAFEWCAAHRPRDPGPPALNWGDARIGNVVYGDDFRPAAVLDWEMAMLGPAELDLGWLLFLHDTALMWLKDLPGFRDRAGVLALYRRRLGRDPRDLHFYEAWAGFRAAAIRAQIVRRDHVLGACDDLREQERSPLVKSLRRLVDLPRPA